MASLAKTIIATGVTSGLGFETIKQLLQTSQPYKVILGARNADGAREAYRGLGSGAGSDVTVLPLELSDLKTVRTFAQQALQSVGQGSIDYLLLNAGISDAAEKRGANGSKWCEPYIVNHLSQHYLTHLLREKLVESKARLVFVSSGAIRNVPDTSVLERDLKSGAGTSGRDTYCETKFVALLGAHWWRRQLADQCRVVAVSPGLIPNTGLGRGNGMKLDMSMPDAKTVPEGGANVLRALVKDDFPEDPERIFLTSWGEWWPKDVYQSSLDTALQDKFCLSKEEIEKEEGLNA